MESKKAEKLKSSFGFSVLVFAIAVAIISGGLLFLHIDAHMPIVIATVFLALMGLFVLKIPWEEIEKGLINGIATALQAIIILLIIGMVIGIWIQSGVVPTLIYYGLSTLSRSTFLVGTLLISSIVSLATGSSWTTTATIGIALLGVSHGLGIPAPLTAGVVISGAYLGDKMSPLSDTTNLASACAGARIFDHIRAMCWSTAPTYVIVVIITIVLGLYFRSGTLDLTRIQTIQSMLKAEFSINLLGFIPPTIVIACCIFKMPAIPGLFMGVIAGAIMSVFQGNSPAEIIQALHYGYEAGISAKIAEGQGSAAIAMLTQYNISAPLDIAIEVGDLLKSLLTRGGMDSMLWTISLIICALAFGGVAEACGFLDVIISRLTEKAQSPGDLMASALLSCFVANLFFGDNYLAIAVPGRMFRNAFAKAGLAPMMLSRATEDCGTLTSVMIPWNSCGAFVSRALGIPTLVYAPYCFLNYLNPLVSLVLSYLRIGLYWGNRENWIRAREQPSEEVFRQQELPVLQ